MKNPLKSIQMKQIHADVKRQLSFYGKSRTYRQLLSECISMFYRSLSAVKTFAQTTVETIENFYAPCKYNP